MLFLTMDGIKVLKRPFLFLFNCVCVFMAFFYTWIQIETYFENANSSAIGFEVLTEGLDGSYPTYTICFEDNNANEMHPMYKTRLIDTFGRFYGSRYSKSQIGHRFYELENSTREKLADSFCPEECAIGMEGSRMRYFNVSDILSNETFEMCEFWSIDDDEKYVPLVILIEKGGKWYAISSTQYPEALMGIDEPYSYGVLCPKHPSQNGNRSRISVQLPLKELYELEFNKQLAMDFQDIVLDYETRNYSGEILGWVDEKFKESKTFCYFEWTYYDKLYKPMNKNESLIKDGPGKSDFVKKNCKGPIAWRKKFESRMHTTYPFDKVYQDPQKICYSPQKDPRIYREKDSIRLNLVEMFESWYDYRDEFSNFMSIYVHPQGQFLRNLQKKSGAHSLRNMFAHCDCCRYKRKKVDYRSPNGSFFNADMNPTDAIYDDDFGCRRKIQHYATIATPCNCMTTIYNYEIYQLNLLKDRPDSNNECDPDLLNEDEKIMDVVIEHIGCYPSFWEEFVQSRTTHPKCKELSQYQQLANMTYSFTRYDNFASNFTRPCHDMSIILNEISRYGEKMERQIHTKEDESRFVTEDEEDSEMCVTDPEYVWPNGSLRIDPDCESTGWEDQDILRNPLNGNKRVKKTFQQKFFGPYFDLEFTISTGGKYQVIENSRAFSVENCWSGIGGFVGIFVGLSLMAVPDLIQDFYDFLKTKFFRS